MDTNLLGLLAVALLVLANGFFVATEFAIVAVRKSRLQQLAAEGHTSAVAAHGVAVGTSFGIITALHIVIGELAPKGLALQRPEATALAVARPMQLFETVFRLPIRVLNGVGNWVLRLFGLEPASGHEIVHSVDELRLLVTGMQEAGVVDQVEARI